MPFVKIFIDKTIKKDTKENISKSIHTSLIECFDIPSNDKFQVFVKVDKEDLVFPDEYLGNNYSNIVFINITCKAGRTKEQKKGLYEMIVNSISKNTNIKKDDVFITIVENSQDNWSFGNGLAQLMDQ